MLLVQDDDKRCRRPVRRLERVVCLSIVRGDASRVGEVCTVITRCADAVRVQFDDGEIALSFAVRLADAADELARLPRAA